MAKRACNLLSVLLVAAAVYSLLPVQESFMAPQALRGATLNENPSMLAQGNLPQEARSIQVSMAATGGEPTRFPLVFLGLLAGTAAVGLLAVFFYGSYSGAGSGL
ncbi:psbJ [Symbiodinium natans]|uniref:PsbJ protein n=1 Tax=Symbiodinium natans TaxID=878477 RepID=A0A812I8Q1_9DINO|nr:psbJ [Symbiodinium natans]